MNTDSLFLCLNAEAGKIPAKLNLLPAGGFVAGRDGRRWTKRNPEVIAQKSNEYLPQHPIDENHSTDLKASKGEAAPAMGWFTNIEAKEDGSIWADARGRRKKTLIDAMDLRPLQVYWRKLVRKYFPHNRNTEASKTSQPVCPWQSGADCKTRIRS